MGGVEEPEEVAADTSPILPMEAKSVKALPDDDGWQFEPKWDGFRCLAFKSGDQVAIYAKSGKPLGRFFPEVVEAVRALPARRLRPRRRTADPDRRRATVSTRCRCGFIPPRAGSGSSRKEIPATLKLFDILTAPGGTPLVSEPLTVRREALEDFVRRAGAHPGVELSTYTRDRAEAQGWLDNSDPTGSLDGVVAKRLDGPYVSGERAMLKIKRIRTADCVVGGFRYGTGSTLMGSILLGLYDDAGAAPSRRVLVLVLERREAGAHRRSSKPFAASPASPAVRPGGPSRWSTDRTETYVPLRHELVVEVAYDHVTSGRFRHGSTFIRWRPDKAPSQCTMEQLGG